MQVALLLGANPRNITLGPRVVLAKDKNWGIVAENIKDTEYDVHVDSDTLPLSYIYRVEITKKGTEPFISLFARTIEII